MVGGGLGGGGGVGGVVGGGGVAWGCGGGVAGGLLELREARGGAGKAGPCACACMVWWKQVAGAGRPL